MMLARKNLVYQKDEVASSYKLTDGWYEQPISILC